MKKLLSVICILAIFILTGCGVFSNEGMKLKYEPLSEKERRILSLTGDKIIMYNVENIAEGKGFEVEISYELYEGNVKIKEEGLTGIGTGGPTDKEIDLNFGINIQDNQVRSNINMEGSMTFSKIDMDLSRFNQGFLSKDVNLNLGDEVYIFHGATGETFSPINFMSKDEDLMKSTLANHEENFLIKFSIKEVTE